MRNFYKFTFIILFSLCARAQVPTAGILSSSASFCTGAASTFSAVTSATTASFAWVISPAKFISQAAGTGDIITFTASTAGTYTVTLTVTTPQTVVVISKPFNVIRSAKASFNASLSGQGFPSQLMLTNYSSNSIKNYWIFDGNTAAKDSSATLVKNYPASGNYTVDLVAKGTNNCDDISRYVFHIADSSGVTLPNVFTPNNDGVNDLLRPTVRGILSLNAWVYNREGVVVAAWDRVNGFWDGHTTSGEECSAGSYFLVVEAKGFDGKLYKLKSNVTLMR